MISRLGFQQNNPSVNTSFETICEQTAQAESPTSPRRHILVVEDDRVLRQVNAMVLVHSGYAVDMAEDGAAAWEALQTNSYDLLVTDYNMPKLTGIELLKKLRSAHMELPVVIVSGTLPTQELAQNPGLEPVTSLAKPYAPEQLLDTVKEVLHVAFSKRNPCIAMALARTIQRQPTNKQIIERCNL